MLQTGALRAELFLWSSPGCRPPHSHCGHRHRHIEDEKSSSWTSLQGAADVKPSHKELYPTYSVGVLRLVRRGGRPTTTNSGARKASSQTTVRAQQHQITPTSVSVAPQGTPFH